MQNAQFLSFYVAFTNNVLHTVLPLFYFMLLSPSYFSAFIFMTYIALNNILLPIDFTMRTGSDKLLHASLSFLLIFLLSDILRGALKDSLSTRQCGLILLLTLAPASLIKEIYDSFQPFNYIDMADIVANYIGGITAFIYTEKEH